MNEIEQLYHLYYKDVFLYLRALTGEEGLAEELTAETFFRAYEKIGSFRGDCDVRVWLCQIARNLYFKWLKKHRREQPLTEELQENGYSVTVEQLFEDQDAADQIHRYLHEMQEPYKEVFTLRVFGELSFRKIGLLFGKTEGWARVTYLRAKRKLQKRMEESGYE